MYNPLSQCTPLSLHSDPHTTGHWGKLLLIIRRMQAVGVSWSPPAAGGNRTCHAVGSWQFPFRGRWPHASTGRTTCEKPILTHHRTLGEAFSHYHPHTTGHWGKLLVIVRRLQTVRGSRSLPPAGGMACTKRACVRQGAFPGSPKSPKNWFSHPHTPPPKRGLYRQRQEAAYSPLVHNIHAPILVQAHKDTPVPMCVCTQRHIYTYTPSRRSSDAWYIHTYTCALPDFLTRGALRSPLRSRSCFPQARPTTPRPRSAPPERPRHQQSQDSADPNRAHH